MCMKGFLDYNKCKFAFYRIKNERDWQWNIIISVITWLNAREEFLKWSLRIHWT